jgi:hypothetical protein
MLLLLLPVLSEIDTEDSLAVRGDFCACSKLILFCEFLYIMRLGSNGTSTFCLRRHVLIH